MHQTIQICVEDKPGALMRVAGIVTAKGCNIVSLSATPDPAQPGASRIIVVADVDAHLRTRIVNEMNRLVNVLRATDVSAPPRDNHAAPRLPVRSLGDMEGAAC